MGSIRKPMAFSFLTVQKPYAATGLLPKSNNPNRAKSPNSLKVFDSLTCIIFKPLSEIFYLVQILSSSLPILIGTCQDFLRYCQGKIEMSAF